MKVLLYKEIKSHKSEGPKWLLHWRTSQLAIQLPERNQLMQNNFSTQYFTLYENENNETGGVEVIIIHESIILEQYQSLTRNSNSCFVLIEKKRKGWLLINTVLFNYSSTNYHPFIHGTKKKRKKRNCGRPSSALHRQGPLCLIIKPAQETNRSTVGLAHSIFNEDRRRGSPFLP